MAHIRPQDVFVLVICLIVHLGYRYCRRSAIPFPPEPRRWPIIGHALSIPLTFMPRTYKDMGAELRTKILHLEAFGRHIVVLNDAQMARDLMDKRSTVYSSRPHVHMVLEVMGIDYLFALMPYGEEWKNHRRLFEQYFAPKDIKREEKRILDFVRKGLLPNIYQAPEDYLAHIKSCIGGFSTAITYGLPIRRHHDPTVELADKAFNALSEAGTPGRFLVDLLPVLKHVPEWFPGGNFKRLGRQWRCILLRVRDEPYRATMEAIEDGTAPISFVSESLARNSNKPDFELQERHIKQTATQLFCAASETTTTAVLTFILAMLKHPHVQKKAQQEIDSLTGRKRLPTFSDEPDLLYLSAVLREALRWNPPLPLGFPHRTTEDDVYNGYYIPKGSIVIANTLAMLHDDQVFSNPSNFIPERFLKDGSLNPDLPDPQVIATFGFGRRICPGAHIALAKLYLLSASILSIFDISPAVDENGNEINVNPQFMGTKITSEPLPFPCKITPRQGVNIGKLLKDYLSTEFI